MPRRRYPLLGRGGNPLPASMRSVCGSPARATLFSRYPFGQHRWVEHVDYEQTQMQESTRLEAKWHPWIHSMVDETPDEFFAKTGPIRSGAQISTKTPESAANAQHHVNLDNQKEHRMNPTQIRDRQYGIPSYQQEKAGDNPWYAQPGNPANKASFVRTSKLDETAKEVAEMRAYMEKKMAAKKPSTLITSPRSGH